jgi:hypothetical protein
MMRLRTLPMLTALVALSGACFAVEPPARADSPQEQAAPGLSGAAASQGPSKVCIDVQSSDSLIKEFADRLQETIAVSGALSLAPMGDSCNLQLHVPGNLLRFQTAGGVMVSTVVIVTSASGRYLSTSITACQAKDLKPCAARAVAAAKLALLMNPNAGT